MRFFPFIALSAAGCTGLYAMYTVSSGFFVQGALHHMVSGLGLGGVVLW